MRLQTKTKTKNNKKRGELFDRIREKGHYSEPQAAGVIKMILEALHVK